jgi:hypothetical protein
LEVKLGNRISDKGAAIERGRCVLKYPIIALMSKNRVLVDTSNVRPDIRIVSPSIDHEATVPSALGTSLGIKSTSSSDVRSVRTLPLRRSMALRAATTASTSTTPPSSEI